MKQRFIFSIPGALVSLFISLLFQELGLAETDPSASLVKMESSLEASGQKPVAEEDSSKLLQNLKKEQSKNDALIVKLDSKIKKHQAHFEVAQNKVQIEQERKKVLEDLISQDLEQVETLKKESDSEDPAILDQRKAELKTVESRLSANIKERKKLEVSSQKNMKKLQKAMYKLSQGKERISHAKSEEGRLKAEIETLEKQASVAATA